MTTSSPPYSCRQLLSRPRGLPFASGKLTFTGVESRDVYNIAAPFVWQGQRLIAGRVESRENELSEIRFFRQAADAWEPLPEAPVFPSLQDPCLTVINGELILGGVRYPITLPGGETIWRMEFHRGRSLNALALFFTGPDKMKDIRLTQLADGRIGVLTRPQGAKGGRGTIGWLVAGSLDALTVRALEEAPLFTRHFLPTEWGGSNEAHLLKNDKIGVLGHVACFDEREHRHYYPMVFCVDPLRGTAGDLQIIGQRSDFPAGAAKRPDLADVIFSGGLVRNADRTATLFAGLSDAEAGWVTIPDPFLNFE
jgi:hypothetical protein